MFIASIPNDFIPSTANDVVTLLLKTPYCTDKYQNANIYRDRSNGLNCSECPAFAIETEQGEFFVDPRYLTE